MVLNQATTILYLKESPLSTAFCEKILTKLAEFIDECRSMGYNLANMFCIYIIVYASAGPYGAFTGVTVSMDDAEAWYKHKCLQNISC